jgi:NitT/TauT family transport system ATP-binding protein
LVIGNRLRHRQRNAVIDERDFALTKHLSCRRYPGQQCRPNIRTPGQETVALSEVSLEIKPGRFVVLVGPSGCGKSTLLMMMAGLRHPTCGSILINGAPISEPDPNRVGVVFQEASLFPWLTAGENVEFPLTLRKVPRAERREKAQGALKVVGLEGFGRRHPHELSGGMKQRVSIARGLVQDPPVLLMDEPFAALDEQTRMTMGDELLQIRAATGKTVVFVTHSLTEAVYLADEVIVMSARPGRVIDQLLIPLPRPRTYEMLGGDAFSTLRDRVWRPAQLRGMRRSISPMLSKKGSLMSPPTPARCSVQIGRVGSAGSKFAGRRLRAHLAE